jgi:hypothetical protein
MWVRRRSQPPRSGAALPVRSDALRPPAFDQVPSDHRRRSICFDESLGLRLRVRVTRARLDRQLAAGHPCESTAALALRSSQLLDARARQVVAGDLRGVVEFVDRAASGRLISAVVIERAAVRAGREAILGLAERLEGTGPVTPRGMALVRMLLTDGVSSPLFNPGCGLSVAQAVWEIADVLGGDAPTIGFDSVTV